MRQLLATLLMFCIGIMVPMSASPVRICLLNGELSGLELPGLAKPKKDKCCSDCGGKHQDCCKDLKKLPDSTTPSGHPELPVLPVFDLPPSVFVALDLPLVELAVFHPSVPIRGPDSPAAHRAVLAIWRI